MSRYNYILTTHIVVLYEPELDLTARGICQLNVSQLNVRMEHPLTMGSGDSQYAPPAGGGGEGI